MEVLAGRVRNFYSRLSVASVDVIDVLRVGDLIHVKGHTTDFDQRIESMQMKHREITETGPGDIVGIKVNDYVRKRDLVYRVQDS